MTTHEPARLSLARSNGFPYEPTLVDIGRGESLSVVDVGRGHPIVFSHGTPTWSYDWRRLIDHLSPRFRCIAPDHLGFGFSPRPHHADYSPEAHADRFRRWLEVSGVERYSLVVHDFGGPIALDSAFDHPGRLVSLVVINSFAWPFEEMGMKTKIQARIAGSRLSRLLYRNVNLSFLVAEAAYGDRTTRDPAIWAMHRSFFTSPDERERVLFALARALTRSRSFFARLWERRDRLRGTPVHLVWGLRDSALPAAFLSRFQRAWPHASVLSLPAAGHWPHEEQPDVCLESVDAFLRSVRTDSPANPA